jgi:hypothetical protein
MRTLVSRSSPGGGADLVAMELRRVAVGHHHVVGNTRAFIRADAPSWVMSTAMPRGAIHGDGPANRRSSSAIRILISYQDDARFLSVS